MRTSCFDTDFAWQKKFRFEPTTSNKHSKQECIPVGFVPPTLYRKGGGMVSLCPGRGAISVQGILCPGGSLSRGSLSRGYLLKGVSVRGGGSLSVDRHTPVKILLCPKLRLRTVIVSTRQVMHNVAWREQSLGDAKCYWLTGVRKRLYIWAC